MVAGEECETVAGLCLGRAGGVDGGGDVVGGGVEVGVSGREPAGAVDGVAELAGQQRVEAGRAATEVGGEAVLERRAVAWPAEDPGMMRTRQSGRL
ncbi:hypothetical protein [Streptomyces sp. NBC_01233]|uniref:hypothetical protein n=1 Tax=Streptomyces sp. NBC_01233 TaxID=2903787 RepID=UPI003FA3A532